MQVNAMGNEIFGQIQVVEKIATNKLKLIPDVYIGGSTGTGSTTGGSESNQSLMSIALLQYLTGRQVFSPKTGE